MRTVFLTGATGFLGSNIAFHLLKSGEKVIFLIRQKSGTTPKARLEHALCVIDSEFRLSDYSYEIVVGDLVDTMFGLDEDSLDKLSRKNIEIFHSAGCVSFSSDFHKSEHTWNVNVDGTRRILDFAARIGGVHIHYISTAYVVGNSEGLANEEVVSGIRHFNNPYEQSKAHAEVLIRESGLPFTIYRPSVIIGDANGHALNFDGCYTFLRSFYLLKKMFGRLLRNSSVYNEFGIMMDGKDLILPMAIRCSQDSTLNLVPVDWAAKTIVAFSRNNLNCGETFHITDPNPLSVQWLIETALKILRIKGMMFVGADVVLDYGSDILNDLQQKIDEGAKEYKPYIFQVHNFGTFKMRVMLNGNVPFPKIDEAYLECMLAYAVEHSFKSRRI